MSYIIKNETGLLLDFRIIETLGEITEITIKLSKKEGFERLWQEWETHRHKITTGREMSCAVYFYHAAHQDKYLSPHKPKEPDSSDHIIYDMGLTE